MAKKRNYNYEIKNLKPSKLAQIDWSDLGRKKAMVFATGIIDVVTQEGPLSLIPVIASIACLAIGTIFIKRKK